MKIVGILKKAVLSPLSWAGKLVLTPLEKPMNAALKAALTSTFRKTLRALLAVGAAALLAALPVMQDIFVQAAAKGDLIEKAVFGALAAGIVGLMAFVERYHAASKNGQ